MLSMTEIKIYKLNLTNIMYKASSLPRSTEHPQPESGNSNVDDREDKVEDRQWLFAGGQIAAGIVLHQMHLKANDARLHFTVPSAK